MEGGGGGVEGQKNGHLKAVCGQQNVCPRHLPDEVARVTLVVVDDLRNAPPYVPQPLPQLGRHLGFPCNKQAQRG